MATLYTVALTMSLLLFAAGQDYSVEQQDSMNSKEQATMVEVMRDVGEALQCFGGATKEGLSTMQESLQLHKENTDVLRDLHSLPNLILQVREEMHKHKANEDSLDRENEALNKVIRLTQEINGLEIKILNKNHEVEQLSQQNTDLNNQLDNKTQNVYKLNEEILQLKKELRDQNETIVDFRTEIQETNKQNEENAIKVQKLDWKLGNCQKQVEQLEQQNKDLTHIVETETHMGWKLDCEQPQNSQQIKALVQTYINNRRWNSLQSGLKAVLDPASDEYTQLLEAGSLWDVGLNGNTELVSLLLCAGLHVDMTDSGENTMLHGAAYEGKLDLVKMLLNRGATIDVRGQYNKTPLLTAAPGGNLEVIQWLVEAGANTTAKDSWDRTALDWAQSYDQTAVVEYLEELPH